MRTNKSVDRIENPEIGHNIYENLTYEKFVAQFGVQYT